MWSVDRLEGSFAICEETRTGEVRRFPLTELPQGLREGDLLQNGRNGWQIERQEAARRRRNLSKKIKNLFH